MTEEILNEIKQAAIDYACDTDCPEEWSFVEGAKWAYERFVKGNTKYDFYHRQ